jgi:hypothetical protein
VLLQRELPAGPPDVTLDPLVQKLIEIGVVDDFDADTPATEADIFLVYKSSLVLDDEATAKSASH